MILYPENSKQVYTLPRDSVDQLWEVFNLAEKQIKILERDEGDGLDIASVNELRYVAFHLLKSMTTASTVDELKKATNHAHRALFDAHEAQTIDILSKINKFFDDYRLVDIKAGLPDFVLKKAEVISLKAKIEEFPQGDDRQESYRQITEVNNRLIQIANEFEASRHVLNVQMTEKATATRRWFIGIGVAICMAIVGLFLKK